MIAIGHVPPLRVESNPGGGVQLVVNQHPFFQILKGFDRRKPTLAGPVDGLFGRRRLYLLPPHRQGLLRKAWGGGVRWAGRTPPVWRGGQDTLPLPSLRSRKILPPPPLPPPSSPARSQVSGLWLRWSFNEPALPGARAVVMPRFQVKTEHRIRKKEPKRSYFAFWQAPKQVGV